VEQFELFDDEDSDDYYAIDLAKKVARLLLKHPSIKPQQIIGLGNALYALERMPLVTPGALCEYGVEYRVGTEEYNEMRYVLFSISDADFGISTGGSVYDKATGGDSFSGPEWRIELGGYRETDCNLRGIEGRVVEYLNLGAEITVADESEIEFEAA